MGNLTTWLLVLSQLIALTLAGAANWTKPNSLSPSFADTYIVNERIYLSWLSLNDSISDLWLTRYDTSVDKFSLRLQLARNISYPGSFEWTIAVEAIEVAEDTRFILQFLPAGAAYDPFQVPQLPSPAFNIITLNQQSPPNGTIGAPSVTPSATKITVSQTSTPLSPSQTPSDLASLGGGDGTLLTKTMVIGITIGAAVLGMGSIVAAYFIVRVYRRPKPVEVISDPDFKTSGPYEVMGNNKQPSELLSSKETMIYEMNSSKETMISECESPTSVYEISTTIKKPGLHELPG